MTRKNLHRLIGFALTLPLLAWALTGIVFLTKPGYEKAFEQPVLKTYALEKTFIVQPGRDWYEARLLRTALGYHLLVKKPNASLHLDPATLLEKPLPDATQLRRLLEDALGESSPRYGEVLEVSGSDIRTSTGINLHIDWQTLSLSQSGKDTRLINTLYKIHYLQWWGHSGLNLGFGALGIVLLLLLVALGLKNGKPQGG